MFDAITIGTVTRDTFITSKSYHTLKDKVCIKKLKIPTGQAICFGLGSKFEINAPILTTGGGAGNAAVTFARMEISTATFAKIGDDRQGEAIEMEFIKEGISPFVHKDTRTPTASSVIFLSHGGERTIMVYRGASENFSKDTLELNKMRSKWAYIAPGSISYLVLKSLTDYLYSHQTNIAINPSKKLLSLGLKKLTPLFKKTKVLIMNREEASYITGIPYNKPYEIFKALDRAVEGVLVVTDGNKGAYISDNNIIYEAGVYRGKDAIDRTGAGDAFGSGFVSGLILKDESCQKGKCDPEKIRYSIRLATANATSVIEHIGAKEGILTREHFENDKRWETLKIKQIKI